MHIVVPLNLPTKKCLYRINKMFAFLPNNNISVCALIEPSMVSTYSFVGIHRFHNYVLISMQTDYFVILFIYIILRSS